MQIHTVISSSSSASQQSSASTSTILSATATSSSVQATSSPSPSSVPDPNRHLDNFEDYEEVLRRTEEVEAFLSGALASKFIFPLYKCHVYSICSASSPCRWLWHSATHFVPLPPCILLSSIHTSRIRRFHDWMWNEGVQFINWCLLQCMAST